MKVNFNTKSVPIKNAFVGFNVASSASSKNKNLEYPNDVFVKSVPQFKGLVEDTDNMIRRDVIENGVSGIVSCLTLYANPCTSACGHRMPEHEDFDYCMKLFFPLCCAASSAYATKEGGEVKYPNQEEFVEILQTLWTNSEGLEGADLEEYLDEYVVRLNEIRRRQYLYRYIVDDMARAMNVYSQDRYGVALKNLDDVREFALKIYDDDTIRTIDPKISKNSNAKTRQGKMSKEALELAAQPTSAAMLAHLFQNADRFFSYPRSIRQRYESAKPSEPTSIYYSNTFYGDIRTDTERTIDIMNGMPW